MGYDIGHEEAKALTSKLHGNELPHKITVDSLQDALACIPSSSTPSLRSQSPVTASITDTAVSDRRLRQPAAATALPASVGVLRSNMLHSDSMTSIGSNGSRASNATAGSADRLRSRSSSVDVDEQDYITPSASLPRRPPINPPPHSHSSFSVSNPAFPATSVTATPAPSPSPATVDLPMKIPLHIDTTAQSSSSTISHRAQLLESTLDTPLPRTSLQVNPFPETLSAGLSISHICYAKFFHSAYSDHASHTPSAF